MFVGKDVLELGLFDAISHFNISSQTVLNLYEALGITPGKCTVSGCQFLDKERIYNARYHVKEDNKKRRKVLRGQKKKKDNNNKYIYITQINIYRMFRCAI